MTEMVVILAHIISKSIHILMCIVTFISFLIKLVVPFYHAPPSPILKMGHIVCTKLLVHQSVGIDLQCYPVHLFFIILPILVQLRFYSPLPLTYKLNIDHQQSIAILII